MRRNRYPGQPKFPFVLGYDLVGVVTAVGPDVDPALVGRRVAAVTKTGGWTTHALVDARDARCPSPKASTRPRPRRSSSTASPPGRCCTARPGSAPGQTILVHGASGGVGQHPGPARPARRRASHRHRRRRATTTRCARWAPSPSTTTTRSLADRVRELAPDGVDAVFDHLGGPSFERSFKLLARGGTLVAYGTAAQLNDTNNIISTFARPLRAARAVEPAAQPPPRAVLQLLGRQARAAGAVPQAPGRPTSATCSRCWPTVRSRRTSPPASRCATRAGQ